jgi:putative RecB family exonuclease
LTRAAFSHSRLSSFENCPRQYYFRYVENVPSAYESIEAFAGKRVHEILERLYKVVAERGIPALAAVLRRFRSNWDEQYDPQRVRVVRSESSPDDYREVGARCLASYYRRHYPFETDETLGVEERVECTLDGEGEYRVRGVIDRLARARDGAIEIHDYKTGGRIPAQSRLDADRQLALYQIALGARLAPGAPVRLVWHYLAFDQRRTSTRTPEQLEALRRRTIDLIDRIRSEVGFPPRPGPLCDWCEYRDLCPAAAGGRTPAPDAAAQRADRGSAPPPRAGQLPLWIEPG